MRTSRVAMEVRKVREEGGGLGAATTGLKIVAEGVAERRGALFIAFGGR